jgi:hypothetical protein
MVLHSLITAAMALAGLGCPAPSAVESALADERCSCVRHEDPKQNFPMWERGAAFVAEVTVMSIDTLGGPIPGDDARQVQTQSSHPIVGTLKVHRVWKGEPAERVELHMTYAVGLRTSCDQVLALGETYLLYAYDRRLSAGVCSGTLRMERAVERGDPEFLGVPKWIAEPDGGPPTL